MTVHNFFMYIVIPLFIVPKGKQFKPILYNMHNKPFDFNENCRNATIQHLI